MTAKPTNERIAVLETEVKTVKETVTRVETNVSRVETNQATNHENISNKLETLTNLIDGHIANHEKRIETIEETIEPFTKFRRNLWYMLVFSLLGVAFYVMVQTKKVN